MRYPLTLRWLAIALAAGLLGASTLVAAVPARAAAVAATAQANARALIDSGRLTFATSSTRAQVQSYADGAEYIYPSTGRACNINDVLLDALRKVVVDQGFAIRIVSLNRWCEGSEPTAWWQYHIVNGGGHAVDLVAVNGVASTGATAQDVAFVRALAGVLPTPAGVGQQNCGQVLTLPAGWQRFDDTCDHLHVEYRGADVPVPSISANPTVVYRFWSPVYQGHFYTADPAERDRVIATWPTIWSYEGARYSAYASPAPGTVPLYRFWSTRYNGHFYTADPAERDRVIATWPDVWSYEGVAYYVYPNGSPQTGTTPVYRFWSDRYNHHFYTSDPAERDRVIATWPDVWSYEGPRFSVPTAGASFGG
jgi:hypothetical protein